MGSIQLMNSPPTSILIVGSGVFGLSTASALAQRTFFANTAITIVENGNGKFPAPDAASVDSSRIIRADYADPAYAALAATAQEQWRKQGDNGLGGEKRYTESGVLVTARECPDTQEAKKHGMKYVKESWQNVVALAKQNGELADKIRVFEDTAALKDFLGTSDAVGDWGYINGLSGWADAGEGMQYLYEKVKASGRVSFVDGRVKQLVTDGKRVTGAELADGTVLNADVVMVAAGAWTGDLIDLRGRAEATGQVMGYVDLTEEEFKALENYPVVLNLSTGLFVIPPRERVLKVARHGFGYLNPETITTALPVSPDAERKPFVTSRPYTSRDGDLVGLPLEADKALRSALKDLIPLKGVDTRPWKGTRLCWYSDTRDADWLVDWHPGWDGLFVATGGSGHAYKFLPVLGEKVVDCWLGQGGELGQKWRWKDAVNDDAGTVVDGVYQGLITEDGSRGGRKQMILKEELARTE
ncbi:L-pipecolate oxidase [Paramyrothecium foliicola]|nr:L-pipecolate oxidase [Paramyrothecium foliicola]